MILSDGMLGQMMEPVEFKDPATDEEIEKMNNRHKDWCIHPKEEGEAPHHNEINSLEIDPSVLEKHVEDLDKKYKLIESKEIKVEEYNINDDNEIVCVAFLLLPE
jgi:2-oxoglutarate ferredoxin oxidoreductase subunit alpha